jgi:KUP system potassium uptake protein
VRIPTNKVTLAGLLVAIGIIYGDIGTSPLYVFGAIIKNKEITRDLILGGLSCIIWTLTLQTTIKYVILTLRADNNGEGGMFSLFALVRRHGKWAVIPAMMGGAAVLSEGIITPPISVTSAIEGLKQIKFFSDIGQWTIVGIVLVILVILFFLQQFGTSTIGRFFGPVMLIWFTMLAMLGLSHILDDITVLKAFNPYYAIKLLTQYPNGFWILGAVFLCTTGAEALYSDLGHCGRKNIRMSWIFVKSCLILNYLGQGAWLLDHTGTELDPNINPFYSLMPEGFRLIGIIIATAATIVASQALISGSFTLISEAMRLNLWSKLKINYPTEEKGQLFIPAVNMLLFFGCCGVVLYFQKAQNMEAAYGLTINFGMLMNTTLFSYYLFTQRAPRQWIVLYLIVYLTIELAFLVANLNKFTHGGYVSFIIGGILFTTMYIWYRARKIKMWNLSGLNIIFPRSRN